MGHVKNSYAKLPEGSILLEKTNFKDQILQIF